MTFQDIIDQARYRLNNFERPYIWSDAELIFYANEAINIMCRDAKLLIDPTTPATSRITTNVYASDYALSPLVIYVYSAHLVFAVDDIRELDKTNLDAIASYAGWRVDTADTPTQFLLDYRTGYLTLYPAPDAVYTIKLVVARYPLIAFDASTVSSARTPEIDQAYHPAIVDGICYQAYLRTGEHTFNVQKSDIHFKLFRNAIAGKKIQTNMYRGGGQVSGPHGGFI